MEAQSSQVGLNDPSWLLLALRVRCHLPIGWLSIIMIVSGASQPADTES